MNDFRESLLHLDTGRWDRILSALELPKEPGCRTYGLDDEDMTTLSAYRGDLVGFESPVKGSGRL